jgi:hypothetical protein
MHPTGQTVPLHLTPEQAALLEQVVIDGILYAEGDMLEELWLLYRQVMLARWRTHTEGLPLRQMTRPHLSQHKATPV